MLCLLRILGLYFAGRVAVRKAKVMKKGTGIFRKVCSRNEDLLGISFVSISYPLAIRFIRLEACPKPVQPTKSRGKGRSQGRLYTLYSRSRSSTRPFVQSSKNLESWSVVRAQSQLRGRQYTLHSRTRQISTAVVGGLRNSDHRFWCQHEALSSDYLYTLYRLSRPRTLSNDALSAKPGSSTSV